jgi:hypothetical protein
MLYRFVYISPSPVPIPMGQNFVTITGLGLTYFDLAPSMVLTHVIGDGSNAIWEIEKTVPTTDGFTVYFNTNIPNGNFSLMFVVI